ncbi:MAG: selenocysteine-specific translation elongation factor [bacterium]|nr:selenocysteine-specific translation elongation factor [bacterium]
MPFIIGTAGHIDHGKTELIKALTGIETYRFKEERERGITIDIGFAYFDLPTGERAGIVDVPGHERFIRNMLAGATGIDLVLFVVAADDGVMPQTQEHLEILHLLGVSHGIFVITKIDLVTPERIQTVIQQIQRLSANTTLAHFPILQVSAITGQGIPELKQKIIEESKTVPVRPTTGYFRMPIDRVFVLPGFGTIVTGTPASGIIRQGDPVRILPQNIETRVRSIEVHNVPAELAQTGQRTALNLPGIEKIQLHRGNVVCAPQLKRTTTRIDVQFYLLPSAKLDLKSGIKLRLHTGTAEELCHIHFWNRAKLFPGETAFAQLKLQTPLAVWRNDRFILRDEQAQHTLGGGKIINAFAERYRLPTESIISAMHHLASDNLKEIVVQFLAISQHLTIPVSDLAEYVNQRIEETFAFLNTIEEIKVFESETIPEAALQSRIQLMKENIIGRIREFHQKEPLQPGIDYESLKSLVAPEVVPKIYRQIIAELVSQQKIITEGKFIRLPEHQIVFTPEEQKIRDSIITLYKTRKFDPPRIEEISALLHLSDKSVMKVLKALEQLGIFIRLSTDIYLRKDEFEEAKSKLIELFTKSASGQVKAAEFRDALGTSRKLAIPLLEYFDRIGLTLRKGDYRILRKH